MYGGCVLSDHGLLDRVGSSKSPSGKKQANKRIGGLSQTHECELVYNLVCISYLVTFKLMLNQA